jgi:hypothetical protein
MAAADFAESRPDTYSDIVVVGGGCYGSYYVRQLGRAAAARVMRWRRLLVIDRDRDCRVARDGVEADWPANAPRPEVVAREWGAFFDAWLPLPPAGARDAIVPSPLMPHVFFEYLARRARARWPGRTVVRAPLGAPVGTPWQQTAPDGTAYVSHATWTCPVNCIEPRICPHTRDVRDWTMPESLAAWVAERHAVGEELLGPFTFHCTHRAYGVGMVDKAPIQEAERSISDAARAGGVRALVATASHCHGAAALLAIGPIEGHAREPAMDVRSQ